MTTQNLVHQYHYISFEHNNQNINKRFNINLFRKIKMNLLKNLLVITLASAIGNGCSSSSGGGGTPSPDGIYSGNITGGEPSFNGIEEKGIIYNGRYMLLSRQASGITQLFDGNLTVTDTSLSGTGSRYDNFNLRNTIGYDGSFVDQTSASISFTATGNNSNNYPPGSINLTASSALLSKGSATSKLAGSWTGTVGTVSNIQMDLSIDANGTITSGGDQSPQDCLFSGTITPADAAVNVYNVSLTSDGGGGNLFVCTLPADTYSGLAWTEGDTDGTLVLMVANSTSGRAVILTKN